MNHSAPAPSELTDRARALGVLPSFDGGGTTHHASAATLEAVCAALSTEDDPATDTGGPQVHRQVPGVPPSLVYRAAGGYFLRHLPRLTGARVVLEDGETRELGLPEPWVVDIPAGLPLGYHRLELDLARTGEGAAGPDAPPTAQVHLVACPDRAPEPRPAPGMQHCPGIQVQLYQVISQRSWGIGDFADLREFAVTAARELRAGFVVVNPLNAIAPTTPVESSPYLPTTREFLSPLYIAPDLAPGSDRLTTSEQRAFDAARQRARASLTDERIDRDTVWEAKLEALRLCFAAVVRSSPEQAGTATSATTDVALLRFATWCALALEHGAAWRSWPAELQHPESEEVAAFVAANPEQVAFFIWLQQLAEQQLADAHEAARQAGMDLGIVTDLPVGIHPEGADTWAMPQALARGATVGAPPDMFNQQGQDWSQPPLRPDFLARSGYEPFARLIRAALRHAGGVRIDHIIGLGRLWWIPAGMSAKDGAYVTYDLQAMLGVLALEAHRAGAVVVGEDLGMVDPNTRTALADWNILGTSIVWFEHDWDATDDAHPVAYLPPQRYRRAALTTVTTHDLPPTAGYLNAEHVRVRAGLDVLTNTPEEELEHATTDIAAMAETLHRHGMIDRDLAERARAATDPANDIFTEEDTNTLVEALHTYCAASPSVLVAASLVDLVGERRAINVPGTALEYPNWQLPLADFHGRRVMAENCLITDLARRVFAPLCRPAGR